MSRYVPLDHCFAVANLLALYPKESTDGFLADVFGLSRQTISKWRNRPEQCDLHIWQADFFAVKIGCHPSEIWHDWFEKQPCNTLEP